MTLADGPMGFRPHLEALVHSAPGAWGAMLMGFDGIPVDAVASSGAAVTQLEAVAVELGAVAQQLRSAAAGLGAGPLSEVSFQARDVLTFLHPISDEHFVVLCLGPQGNSGKARYLLRVHGPRLAAEL